MTGVSFVVPVYNGERWLDEVLAAIVAQKDGRPFEIITIDDGSSDGSMDILRRWQSTPQIVLLEGGGNGVASALNRGIREAQQPVICQVDQDVVVHPGWMQTLLEALEDTHVAAAQGYYLTDRSAPLLARIMGYDLEDRWRKIEGQQTDHVSTGNTAYDKASLDGVGLFDESLGYGADNDMSYRLTALGKSLRLCRSARSTHFWRPQLVAYLKQQYGVGYGRLDVIRRHPRRFGGDRTSGLSMIMHVPLTLMMLLNIIISFVILILGGNHMVPTAIAAGCFILIISERLVVGIRSAIKHHDPAPLCYAPVHLLRNIVWCWALVRWTIRRAFGRPDSPTHSMDSGS